MRMIILLSLLSLSAFAQDGSEEAMLLNQEMQFLENSVNPSPITVETTRREISEESLEKTYFGEEDSIETKAAAPKRRGL